MYIYICAHSCAYERMCVCIYVLFASLSFTAQNVILGSELCQAFKAAEAQKAPPLLSCAIPPELQ